MTLLIVGILLFVGVHFIPSLAPDFKAAWLEKMGEGGYKGTFSLLLLASFALMIVGWQSIDPSEIFVGSRNSRIRQAVRHPQLTGVFIWALAHLLMNGDSRSVVLFTAMLFWSLGEMVAISKREGEWEKAEIPPIASEILTLVIIVATVILAVYAHPYMTGTQVLY
jgi:uncharacterized membrane protein